MDKYPQLLSVNCINRAAPGIELINNGSPPASMTKIFHVPFADKEFAKTQPAEPAPTIMKSYVPKSVFN